MANNALGIAFCGFIAYLAVVVVVNNFVTQPGVVVNSIKYAVLAAFIIAAGVYWLVKRRSSIDVTKSKD